MPASIWIWYHTVCFGSPFALPFSFKVAAIEGTVSGGSSALGGKTSLLPNPAWLAELLFGTKRGLLFTQPWLLLCAVLPFFWKIPELRLRRLHHFAVMSLAILVFENAGFPGWHGGGSPGPRYLSAALPLFGLFLPHLFQVLPKTWKLLLGVSVLSSLLFRSLVYATWILPPNEPIWPYYLREIRGPVEWTYLAQFFLILFTAGMLYRLFVEKNQSPTQERPLNK